MSTINSTQKNTQDSDVVTISTTDSAIASEQGVVQETESDVEGDERTDIEVDYNTDSGYDDESIHSLISSLGSLEVDPIHQHGHRYHGSDRVLLPDDESEQERLDLQHHILKMCLDGNLTISNLPNTSQNIFDIGTGTGIWAIEMGDKYESAQITGIDLSPIQPLWVPPNVQFEIDDVTKPWLRNTNSMDFIHIRNMVGGISDWKALFAEALDHLKPGGIVEVTEIRTKFDCADGTFEEKGKACKEWADTFHEIAKGMGMDFDPSPSVPGWLSEVGFEDVRMENYSMMLFTKNGWEATSVHALLGKVRAELKDPGMHAFTQACFITGRKRLA
ncbi:Secondary metabolism regulator [Lachnellula suecica]|uniref:Secondary metabolism regulator n=1 Tax=Lachnellula suecica TaxID=602035 RepID=A0A8T9CER7_9HELO|nr:Secondary metabolism regulator [Lachnellula suecica]